MRRARRREGREEEEEEEDGVVKGDVRDVKVSLRARAMTTIDDDDAFCFFTYIFVRSVSSARRSQNLRFFVRRGAESVIPLASTSRGGARVAQPVARRRGSAEASRDYALRARRGGVGVRGGCP